jgi:hypothetical protein
MKFTLYYQGQELTSHSNNYGQGWSGWRDTDGNGMDIESPVSQAADRIRSAGGSIDYAIAKTEEQMEQNSDDAEIVAELQSVISEIMRFY